MIIEEGFCGAEFKLWIKDAYFEKDDGLRQFCRIIHVYRFGRCFIELKCIGRYSKKIEITTTLKGVPNMQIKYIEIYFKYVKCKQQQQKYFY